VEIMPGGTVLGVPMFFATPGDLRTWFAERHADASNLAVGFYKKASGRPSITWPEAVDEALCVGWIDGVRRTIDEVSYQVRFTPRKPRSNWSAVNVARFEALDAAGLVTPAGRRAFEARAPERTGVYSYEQRQAAALDAEQEQEFRTVPGAWEFFTAQAPSYRKTITWWVVSAKRPETRAKRLAALIAESAQLRRL
jgi:uncharacterized protein YdeI (YjbR/CyaY-like superfamily)